MEHHGRTHSFTTILRALIRDKQQIAMIVIYGIGVSFFSLIIPVAVQALVNSIAFVNLLQPVLILTLMVFLLLGASGLLRMVQIYLVELLQQSVFVRLALELGYRIPRLLSETQEKHRGTELINRFFEAVTIQKSFSLLLLDGLALILQSVIGMLLLAVYHPTLLAFDLVLIVALFGILWFPRRWP